MINYKKKIITISVLSLIVISILVILRFPFTFSEKRSDSGWDGVAATSFTSGNGTFDNPYVISNAGELAYLKSLLESEDKAVYEDKSYSIVSSFNYGGYDLTINNSTFRGNIDGNGNTISNFKVNGSIFNSLDNASIKNIALKNIDYTNNTDGAILALSSNSSSFDTIIIESNVDNNANYGGVIYSDNSSNFKNIVVNESINNSNNNLSTFIYNATESNVDNLLIKYDTYDIVKNNTDSSIKVDYFKIQGDKVLLDNSNDISNYSTEDYAINVNKTTFVIKNLHERKMLRSAPRFTSLTFEEHASGVDGDTIYINDLVADYYYYEALNYTYSSNNSLPTLVSKNIYNDSNLVRVMISYSSIEEIGEDTLTGYIGYDSSERQTKIVYYKYLPVVGGTVDITLIDNPFTYRPDNKGFNGWISDTTGVTLSLDRTLYERHATVSATSNGEGGYEDISLSFHASWTEAKIGEVTGSNWDSVFNKFDSPGLVQLETSREVCEPYDMTGYFHRGSVGYYTRYTGYNSSGQYVNNQRCYSSTCYYYTEINGEYYTEGNTYYAWGGSSFYQVYEDDLDFDCHTEYFLENKNMAGFYVNRTFSRGASYTGYYNLSGDMVSGTCNSSSCTYYEFLQSYDENGDPYEVEEGKSYYFLATRDTNIAYLAGNVSGTWGSSYTKPFTFTGLLNGQRSSYTWNVNNTNVNIYNDTTIENMVINSQKSFSNADPSLSSTSSGGWYGTTTYYSNVIANYHNLKIGRGLRRSGTYVNFDSFVGGNAATGSSSNNTKYNLVIESGFYSNGSLTEAPARQTSDNLYIQANAVYGNDYDRITGNNSNLEVYFCASGSWAGKIYSSRVSALELTVKSGSFGTGKSDMYTGIYIGGRSYGTHNAARSVKVEGGYIYNLIGGPLTASTNASKNDTFIYQTGGSIDMIIAGAGRSATYGNRIIALTGGKVNYSVFGGSNGSGTDSSDGDGTLNGTSYIYVGGIATIGDDTLINNNSTLFGAEAGSVFGIGNGKSGSSGIGSNDNSNIIIDGYATVKRNIYGGGNYGATGLSGSVSSTTSNIKVYNGTVVGNIYGGGNQNGAGDSSTAATINIDMAGGTVEGNIYGGSNVSGTIYGNTNVTITGGEVETNVYGGGKGNNTFVRGNVTVNVGNVSASPRIKNVYGGSAFGTVNSTSSNGTAYGNTIVNINNGVVTGAVFGGGEGSSSYTPYVVGNITVNINGGSVTDVYGGHDQAGTHSKTNYIYLNGGNVENVYGGGRRSSVTTTHAVLDGSTVNSLYGGSNVLGNVTTSNVTLISGTVTNVYGGNNEGGSCTTTNVSANGTAHVLSTIYGGGNKVNAGTSNVSLASASGTIANVYGGGNEASVTNSNVTQSGTSVTNLFGGSKQSGTVTTSLITHNSGNTANIYGGNNMGGSTQTSTINYNNGTTTNIFGGGNEASHTTSNVNVYNGTITNVYGGGNKVGLTNANVIVGNNSSTTSLNITNVFGGSNESGVVTNPIVTINKGIISYVYGGNNLGGSVATSNVTLNGGTITYDLYGGGNSAIVSGNTTVTLNGGTAGNVFGAGNLANVNGNTTLTSNNTTVVNSIYGGGNEARVNGSTNVTVKNTSAGQVYAGGNGRTAVVVGNTTVNIGTGTVVGSTSSTGVGGSVFGSGNQAATGLETADNSVSTVNILGGTIYGNVYGGANTSVVYGTANIKVGSNAVNNTTLTNNLGSSIIYIRGTVFGGGETNESQSATFNYDAISVTQGIDILIDGSGYDSFIISGSIFGSGNASNTPADKPSTVVIKNYGTLSNPEYNASIQRVKNLTIDNSVLELSGVRDSTDDYHPTDLFSLNRIKSLVIKNNTSIFLREGTNYLEELSSRDASGNITTVEIDENGNVTKSSDNRVYVLEGRHVNLAHDGSATDYANMYGMAFFGMYNISISGTINMKMYSPSISEGDTVNWADVPISGSYVLGKHEANHNTHVDGFYSNFYDEEEMIYHVRYIEPTPASSTYYYWMIGEQVIEYNINLVASKYSTLGTIELTLRGLDKPNTSFQLLGFDYSGLANDINLVDKSTIRGLANNSSVANSTFGLRMESSNSGWLNWGGTSFYSNESTPYSGTTYYIGDNTSDAPSLLFYLYHYKDLSQTRDIGTVVLQMMAITKIDDINSDIQRIVISIDLSTAVYTTSEYEGAMTPGKKYDLFTSTTTKITTDSSLSAYYSLFGSETNLYRDGYKHVLTSNYVFPENTKLTLIDLSLGTPKYYYYIVSASDVTSYQSELSQYNEVSYPLSKFILMDTIGNNHYDDSVANAQYYHNNNSYEEFIIQVDFADSNISTNQLDKYLYPELQDRNGNLIIGAIPIERDSLKFSIYKNASSSIDLSASIANNTLYDGSNSLIEIESTLNYDHETSDIIYDTKYYEDNLGLVIYLTQTRVDENNNTLVERVSGNTLMGSFFSINGTNYYPDATGETRVKYSERMGNIKSYITFNLTNAKIPTGNYSINIALFGSSDGIHYSNDPSKISEVKQLPVRIVLSNYGLKATLDDDSIIIVNNDEERFLKGIVEYSSYLTNPNIRIKMSRRSYETVYSTDYEEVDMQDYIDDILTNTTNDYEYVLVPDPVASNSFNLKFKDEALLTGTYRLDFELYDSNSYIGKHAIYIVIKNEYYAES